jgi:hypothetical protein
VTKLFVSHVCLCTSLPKVMTHWNARDKTVLAEPDCIICNIPSICVYVFTVCPQIEQRQEYLPPWSVLFQSPLPCFDPKSVFNLRIIRKPALCVVTIAYLRRPYTDWSEACPGCNWLTLYGSRYSSRSELTRSVLFNQLYDLSQQHVFTPTTVSTWPLWADR